MAPLDPLEADLVSDAVQQGERRRFWTYLDREGSTLFFDMHAPDGRSYVLRLTCDGYPTQPIGARFVVRDTRAVHSSGWPGGNSEFEKYVKFNGADERALFFCWQKDRFTIRNHHKNWEQLRKWTDDENPLRAYLNFVRELLHLPSRGYERSTNVAS